VGRLECCGEERRNEGPVVSIVADESTIALVPRFFGVSMLAL
jgi:hypothetical protein